MKTVIMMVASSFVLIAGCADAGKNPGLTYSPVIAGESFSKAASGPSRTEYNFKHYDEGIAGAFLASINESLSDGNTTVVDGLTWKNKEWEPISMSPFTVLKSGDDVVEYILLRYAERMANHHYVGSSSLAMENKR
jgi:hypothetical protein